MSVTVSPFRGAMTAGIASINAGGLTPIQWAEAAAQCAQAFHVYGIEDPVVRSAAALGGIIALHSTASTDPSSVIAAFKLCALAPVDAGVPASIQMEGRTALRLATHAAILNSRGLSMILLTTVERELTAAIAGPSSTSMESALENWRPATALVGGSPLEISPHLAVAIASTQIELLRRSRDLLSVVDVNPQIPGSPDRLRSSIEANIQAWSKAAKSPWV